MDLKKNFAELSDDALVAYAIEVRTALEPLLDIEVPTEAQMGEAEGYGEHLDSIATEQTRRTEAAAKLAARRTALRSRFGNDGDDDSKAEDMAPPEEEEPVKPEGDSLNKDEDDEGTVGTKTIHPPPGTEGESASTSSVVALSRKVTRPAKPAVSRAPIVITAAADVPDFATGSQMAGLEQVGKAVVNRMRGFATPSGDGETEDLRQVGVAACRLDFPKELTIDRHSDDMEVLAYAARESRLPGGSLVAAGGWCAPSETIYDLCAGETAEGLVSVPEVNVARGGIKYTTGPDFGSIYSSVGFCQTEAQAIAGNTKTCVEVPCPTFVEVRLDVCGLCIKAPILTNAAYPELVQRFVSGAMIAHQHKMNAKVLTAIATGSAAKTAAGLGAVATDTWEALTLYADQVRQKYRLSPTASLEVILPFWVRDVLRADISRRTAGYSGQDTDATIAAGFSSRHLNVQYVYDWQELPYVDVTGPPAIDADAWPKTFDAVMYPAGAWIKGTADVINLNAVYDAASLAVNVYTALFFEQGILVAKQCYDSLKVTLPVCTAGRSGALNLTCS